MLRQGHTPTNRSISREKSSNSAVHTKDYVAQVGAAAVVGRRRIRCDATFFDCRLLRLARPFSERLPELVRRASAKCRCRQLRKRIHEARAVRDVPNASAF